MRRARWLLVLAGLGCARGSSPDPQPAPEQPEPVEAAKPEECPMKLNLDSHDSVLREHRGLGANVPDFHERFAAQRIDPDEFIAVKATEAFAIEGRPLLWFTPDKTQVVVDAAVLSDLSVVDATSLRAGERHRVGTIEARGRQALDGLQWVEFLLRARAIGTFVHIGSQLCVTPLQAPAGWFTARIEGTHTYFTNQENVEPIRVEVSIDDAGVITVTGVESDG